MGIADLFKRRTPIVLTPGIAPRSDSGRRLMEARAAQIHKDQERADSAAMINTVANMGTDTDSGSHMRPNTASRLLSVQELAAAYHTSLYGRLCDLLPFWAMVRGWRFTAEVPSEVQKRVLERYRDLQAPTHITDLLARGGALGEARLLLVTTDPLEVHQDLVPEMVQKLRAVHVLTPSELQPLGVDKRPESQGFRRPLSYRIKPHGIHGLGKEIHTTRLLRGYGQETSPAEDMRFISGLWPGAAMAWGHRWWDAIATMATADVGARRALIELSVKVFRLMEPSMLQDDLGGPAGDVISRLTKATRQVSVSGAVTLLPGEEFSRENINVGGFDQLSQHAQEMLALVTGFPIALMFGEAPSGLSADQGSWWASWEARVSSYQETDVRPILEVLVRCLLAEVHYTGSWGIEFNALAEESPGDVAKRRLDITTADVAAVGAGFITAEQAKGRYTEAGFLEQIPVAPPPLIALPETDALRQIVESMKAKEEDANADAPDLDSQIALAEHMNKYGVDRCFHNSVNRCRFCGIERDHGIVLDEFGEPVLDADGKHVWRVQWKAIGVPSGGAQEAQAAQEPGPEVVQVADSVRTDADFTGKALLSVHLGEAGRRAWLQLREQAAAITGPLQGYEPDEDGIQEPPHVTVLYLGKTDPADLEELQTIATEVVSAWGPLHLTAARVETFTPTESSEGRWPVVVGVQSWALADLHSLLLRRLAHLVHAPQFETFRPHVTLGYAPELSGDQRAALLELVPKPSGQPGAEHVGLGAVAEVVLMNSGETVARLPLVGERVDAADVVQAMDRAKVVEWLIEHITDVRKMAAPRLKALTAQWRAGHHVDLLWPFPVSRAFRGISVSKKALEALVGEVGDSGIVEAKGATVLPETLGSRDKSWSSRVAVAERFALSGPEAYAVVIESAVDITEWVFNAEGAAADPDVGGHFYEPWAGTLESVILEESEIMTAESQRPTRIAYVRNGARAGETLAELFSEPLPSR